MRNPFCDQPDFCCCYFSEFCYHEKKNQLSELACLTNLTISVMKDNAFKQNIKSNFFSSLKAVLYQFWPYKLYDNYMVLTLT